MTDVPDAAVTTAYAEFGKLYPQRTAPWDELAEWERERFRRVIGAAWPHLLAAAGKLLTEDDCRRIMQETVDSQKSRLLDEVAKTTDEWLERTAELVRAAERHLERARISNGAEDLKFSLFRPGLGNGPEHGGPLEVVPLGELLKLIGGEDD